MLEEARAFIPRSISMGRLCDNLNILNNFEVIFNQ